MHLAWKWRSPCRLKTQHITVMIVDCIFTVSIGVPFDSPIIERPIISSLRLPKHQAAWVMSAVKAG